MNAATSDIRFIEFTPCRDGVSPFYPGWLGQFREDENIGTVIADGANDTRYCDVAILGRDAAPIIPIRKNGRPWKEDCPAAQVRNETLCATRHYNRAFWKSWTGYHVRSRIEAKMRCLNAFASALPQDARLQTAEIHVRIALINRFNALGTAEIIHVA